MNVPLFHHVGTHIAVSTARLALLGHQKGMENESGIVGALLHGINRQCDDSNRTGFDC